ncbi:phospholipid/glycerol acyltransferase [Rippkaea orientalis PCC 8801]|uniref:Phospholipid/glycerol acyltransferase n=1 Tax=Rippkaea orientalis (strain PCC 8801 / RF-1) TaxID=41431 RepID=B7K684_RIPO1|nr:1-acyl-sn-glycerol-3-phosphate acyltransferase [Rippkaea orientalis]ACK68137.1 phospholipid/glycerol acyltransferase [Rippkaea orientalis PCC 8801]
MSIPRQKLLTHPFSLPTLTPKTIQRAQEGLVAAQNSAVRGAIYHSLQQLERIIEGKFDHRLSGSYRHWILRSLIHSLFRVKIEYPERIPRNRVILVANHLNHLDPFLLLSEVPASPYYYILGDSRSLYNKRWKRLILGLSGGVIPLQRRWGQETAIIEAVKAGNEDLKSLAEAIEENVPSGNDIKSLRQIDRAVKSILDREEGIILFPEGRLGTTEGSLTVPLKRGTALYALRGGVPIVPVALSGTKHLYWRKTLTLTFGEPLLFPQIKHPQRKEIEAVLETLEKAMVELLPKDYQEPDEPKLFANFLNQMFY